jgi:hypothetical protein
MTTVTVAGSGAGQRNSYQNRLARTLLETYVGSHAGEFLQSAHLRHLGFRAS